MKKNIKETINSIVRIIILVIIPFILGVLYKIYIDK